MFKKRKLFQQIGITILMSFSSTALFATGIVGEQISGSDISFMPNTSYDVAILRVSSNDTDVTNSFAAGEQISIDLSTMSDGFYNYQLSLFHEKVEDEENQSISDQAGQFRITNGMASVYNEAVAETEAVSQ